MAKEPKPKKVSFELITRDSVVGHPMFCLLDELIDSFHGDLRQARIGLAWCTSWNADVDGRVTLGKCKKASDLDREIATYDFIILLRKAFWQHDAVTPQQRRALLDHELHHAAPKLDKTGEQQRDERDRPVWRIRKHDIEEFTPIVERYGAWTRDLEQMFAALLRASTEPFKPCANCSHRPGWVTVIDGQGVKREARCPCWLAWQGLRTEAAGEAVAV